MARDTSRTRSSGATLRGIAIASAATYTVFAIVAASGGAEATYQVSLWASWALVAVVSLVTFGIGLSLGRKATTADSPQTDRAPVLTSVN